MHARLPRVLVTGGAGFIGSNLAHRLAGEGHEVTVLDTLARPGVEANLDWLRASHGERIRHVNADIRDSDAVEQAVRDVSAVFHFAAQVAVTTSLSDPRSDFEINAGGTFTLLEALRRRGRPGARWSSPAPTRSMATLPTCRCNWRGAPTSRLTPQLRRHGIAEDRRLDFHTPYGCSKGAADQYVLDYARSFGVPAAVLRMSCIYGPRQRGTEDQGWVAHFLISAHGGPAHQPLWRRLPGARRSGSLRLRRCLYRLRAQHRTAWRGRPSTWAAGPPTP